MTKDQLTKIYSQANMDAILSRARRSAIADYEIMRARTKAAMRGATPLEIQYTIHNLLKVCVPLAVTTHG